MARKTPAMTAATAVTTEQRAHLMDAACNAYYRADRDLRDLREKLAAAEIKAETLRLAALETCGTAHLAP